MWELDSEESWAQKNWCFWTVVLEKTLESLGLQGDPTSPSWKRSILGVHWKDWCWSWNSNTLATWCEKLTHWKAPDAWRDWGQEEEGTTEDEMAGWHHWLDGHEFEYTPGVCDGQGSLACCDLWGRKESDMTEWLNWAWNFPPHWIPSQQEIDTSPAWVTMLECRLGMNFKVGDYSVAHSGIILRLHCKYNIQPFHMGILMSALELNWRLLPMDDSLKSPTCFVTWAKVASSRAHGSWSFCHKCKMYS